MECRLKPEYCERINRSHTETALVSDLFQKTGIVIRMLERSRFPFLLNRWISIGYKRLPRLYLHISSQVLCNLANVTLIKNCSNY